MSKERNQARNREGISPYDLLRRAGNMKKSSYKSQKYVDQISTLEDLIESITDHSNRANNVENLLKCPKYN